ncbi:hypothetical protein [Flavobacterium sp.]
MEKKKKNLATRILKYMGILTVVLLVLMVVLPVLFPGKISQEVKSFANDKLDGKLNFKEAKLSFFEHFPC